MTGREGAAVELAANRDTGKKGQQGKTWACCYMVQWERSWSRGWGCCRSSRCTRPSGTNRGEEGDGNEVRLSAAVAGLLGCPLRGAVEKRERERKRARGAGAVELPGPWGNGRNRVRGRGCC